MQPTTHCKDCTKITYYCSECFKCAHNFDSKKTHASEEFDPANFEAEEKKRLEQMCSKHPDCIKQYVCTDCEVLICDKCGLIGDHKSHNLKSKEGVYDSILEDYKMNGHKVKYTITQMTGVVLKITMII